MLREGRDVFQVPASPVAASVGCPRLKGEAPLNGSQRDWLLYPPAHSVPITITTASLLKLLERERQESMLSSQTDSELY